MNASTRVVRRRRWVWPPAARAAAAIIAAAGLALLAAACGGSPGSQGAQLGSTATPSGSSSNSPAASAQERALAYSRCMRSNGVSNFPDPDSSGSFQSLKHLQSSPGSDLNPNNPQFQTAQNACQHLLPNRGSGPTQAQVQQYRSVMLKYARCMRAHGVSNMPDPDSRGHLNIGPGTNVDVNSPQFQTAFQACKSNLSP